MDEIRDQWERSLSDKERCVLTNAVAGNGRIIGHIDDIKKLILQLKLKAKEVGLGYEENWVYSDIQQVLSNYERRIGWKAQIV